MTVKPRFKFEDIVKHKLGDKEYLVVAIQINKDGEIFYGCSHATDNQWHWFKEFEIVGVEDTKSIGFNLEIKEK